MDVRDAAEAVFRAESGRIMATLIRLSGSFDRAEEAMQEAFASALAAWPERGIPDNPAAWITATAHRKLIDQTRREHTRRDKQDALRYEVENVQAVAEIDSGGEPESMKFPDDRLRLMFTCCHPALHREAQVALTLRTLGGLTTVEIAKAFLVSESTLAQRLVRARRKIQEARIPYEVPPPHQLAPRLSSVQAVVYLIFNEGYTAACGDRLVRLDLCAEAIRLGRVLQELLPHDCENLALLALMLLHHSRRDARIRNSQLVTLEEQDRKLWYRQEIAEGLELIDRALQRGPVGQYQIQAAIAAVHAEAKAAAETDWNQIAALYGKLLHFNSSAVIALNHAVAIAMSSGLEEGLRRIDDLGRAGELDQYYLFHAARADILRRMDRSAAAKEAYLRAFALTANEVERQFLRQRIVTLD
ncbi:MAG TPA: sigma-70 family RNA polymerase sigma factor [Bryobacteraceae bacterium]|nr:sigma-70 family RNA polymerase sigma factor [Bryobacteraceae bacterium]